MRQPHLEHVSEARNTLARVMMEQVGVPKELCGIPEGVDYESPLIGGKYRENRHYYFHDSNEEGLNVKGMGVAIDAGVDDPRLMIDRGFEVPTWARASIKARIEAVIVHELVGACSAGATVDARHLEAIDIGHLTGLPISETARQILREQSLFMK